MRVADSLELELETIVSHNVDTGNQALVLCKNKCVKPLSSPQVKFLRASNLLRKEKESSVVPSPLRDTFSAAGSLQDSATGVLNAQHEVRWKG